MSGLKERLERLRRTAAPAGGGDLPQAAEERAAPDHSRPGRMEPVPPDCLHPAFHKLGVSEVRNEAGAFLHRRVVYPFPHRHGRHDLQLLWTLAPQLEPIAHRQSGKRRSAKRGPNDGLDTPVPEAGGLLFLDTETTGLGVGTGNVPFMIGIGTCERGAFVVEQCLIRHPGEERAMLSWLTGRFGGVTHLVTYNGRSFDWPVLLNRLILNGWRLSGSEPGHIDFLHPSRALWKHTLPTCRLSTVEEQRLGIVREDDMPGALAPELYMRFLRDGNPEHLSGVYAHNEKDILTLAALAVHFGKLLGGGTGPEPAHPVSRTERFRTAAWLEEHGQADEALRLYAGLAEESEASDGEIGWRLELAARLKRLGRLNQALALWQQAAALAESARFPRAEAHIELAMYYEHKAKDLEKALAMAETALLLTLRRYDGSRGAAGGREREQRELCEKRIQRLRRKLKGSFGDLFSPRGQSL